MVAIITDGNWRDELRSEHKLIPREIPLGELPYSRVYSEADFPLVPEEEWPERIKEMDAKKLWPIDRYDSFNPVHKSQDGLNLCWIYSGGQAAEMTMAVENRPYIELAPESCGGAVEWNNSGYSIEGGMKWFAEHGMATRAYVPAHNLNTMRWKQGWKEDALKCRPTEYVDCGYRDEGLFNKAASMLLHGKFVPWVGLNWWRHAVTYGKLVIVKGEVCAYTRNTHARDADRILTGRYKIPDSLVYVRELCFREAA